LTGNPISRALFFWPGALLIRFGQWLLAFSETGIGRYTLRPLFRVFCRFALYARPYILRGSRTNDVVTLPQLDALIGRHRLIAAIPCACRVGRPACGIPTHGEHDLDACLSFGLAAIVQIGSGLGQRLTPEMAKNLCRRGAESGLVHHAIYSFGSLLEVCNCCSATCSVVRACKAGVPEAVRPTSTRAVRGPECNGCCDRDSRVCEEVCPYGHHPSSSECLGCDQCVNGCPQGAVSMVSRKAGTAQEVMQPSHRITNSADRAGQFSLRDLLVSVAAVASVLGGFSLYGITGVAIVTLILSWYLTRRANLLDAPWVFTGGGVLMIGSLVVVLFMFLGWVLLGIGPLLPHHSRPWGLSRMVEVSGVAAREIKVAGVGGWLDREYVWRLPMASDELEAIAAEYELEEVSARDTPGCFWRIFPPWWRPWHRPSSRYLSTRDFPSVQRGPDGEHFFAMYDPGAERLYVWCKSNF
jgi:hypothetical protein